MDTNTINGDVTTNTSTSILTLTSVQPSDSGTYQCVVNNSIGQDSVSIPVSIQGKLNNTILSIQILHFFISRYYDG